MALLANILKNKKFDEAMWTVANSGKGYKGYFIHALTNAQAMLKDKGATTEEIWVKNASINQGQRMKRFRPGSRGYSYTYKHSLSHLTLTLTDEKKEKKTMEHVTRNIEQKTVNKKSINVVKPKDNKSKENNGTKS
jgi:ribosomal protein L22